MFAALSPAPNLRNVLTCLNRACIPLVSLRTVSAKWRGSVVDDFQDTLEEVLKDNATLKSLGGIRQAQLIHCMSLILEYYTALNAVPCTHQGYHNSQNKVSAELARLQISKPAQKKLDGMIQDWIDRMTSAEAEIRAANASLATGVGHSTSMQVTTTLPTAATSLAGNVGHSNNVQANLTLPTATTSMLNANNQANATSSSTTGSMNINSTGGGVAGSATPSTGAPNNGLSTQDNSDKMDIDDSSSASSQPAGDPMDLSEPSKEPASSSTTEDCEMTDVAPQQTCRKLKLVKKETRSQGMAYMYERVKTMNVHAKQSMLEWLTEKEMADYVKTTEFDILRSIHREISKSNCQPPVDAIEAYYAKCVKDTHQEWGVLSKFVSGVKKFHLHMKKLAKWLQKKATPLAGPEEAALKGEPLRMDLNNAFKDVIGEMSKQIGGRFQNGTAYLLDHQVADMAIRLEKMVFDELKALCEQQPSKTGEERAQWYIAVGNARIAQLKDISCFTASVEGYFRLAGARA